MDYNSLISIRNLELAWQRIQTGQNYAYKRFYRPAYLGFSAAVDPNLRHLNKLLKGVWKPSAPIREFLPKPSGLQRPLGLLSLEDQIVYQAVANVFAKKIRAKRVEVEGKYVFSNQLSPDDNSIFLFTPWKYAYRDFRQCVEDYYKAGLHWMAVFDLSAFYDTISHELLIKTVSPRDGHHDTWVRVRQWFNCWSSSEKAKSIHHGIPQGPISSDLLAECLLLPLDYLMMKNDVKYARYVDDIRIFADNKLELQKTVVILEQWCRESGLIPHGDKFAIKEVSSVEEAVGSLPSIRDGRVIGGAGFTTRKAEKLFQSALKGRPQRIDDKSRARYVLYRAEKSKKILDYVLRLIPMHPEHIDAFVAYLLNYEKSRKIENRIVQLLEDGIPYEYVRGELWLTTARIGSEKCLKRLRPLAVKELKAVESTVLEWGAIAFLLSCENSGIGKISNRLPNCRTIVKSLVIPVLGNKHYEKSSVAARLLMDSDFQVGISMGHEMAARGLGPSDLGIKVGNLDPYIQNSFRGIGCIKRRRVRTVDQVGMILSRRYSVPYVQSWRALIGTEYDHALDGLIAAESQFDGNPSGWLQEQDAFNDIVIRSFINILGSKGLPGAMKTKGRGGIDYGRLVEKNSGFENEYPLIATHFRNVHQRRNSLPPSHPYTRKGTRNKRLLHGERTRFVSEMEYGYGALIVVIIRII